MHAPTILIGHKASKNKTKTRVHYCLSKEKRINAVLEIQFSLNPFFIGYEFLFKSKTFQIENILNRKHLNTTCREVFSYTADSSSFNFWVIITNDSINYGENIDKSKQNSNTLLT